MSNYSDHFTNLFLPKWRAHLLSHGIQIIQETSIQYGRQFHCQTQEQLFIIRTYDSKKGISIDLSQTVVSLHPFIERIAGSLSISVSIKGNTIKESAINRKSSPCAPSNQEPPYPLIGADESGKGDYFGPLVVAAVWVDLEMKETLISAGVKDSKKLSPEHIQSLSQLIKDTCPYQVYCIDNPAYNHLYQTLQNLNTLLAKAHAQNLEALWKTHKATILVDQFAKESCLLNEIPPSMSQAKILQQTKGESVIAVAAASILARDRYVSEMTILSDTWGYPFPKGAAQAVSESARYFRETAPELLPKIAKTHFNIT